MKPKLLLIGIFLLAGLFSSAQKSTDRFIEKYLPLAQDLKQEWGIPISIILGVSIIESGSGTSLNAKQLNNFFGVKGKNSLKKRKSSYKQFASPKDSFEQFCSMISRKKFYPKLKGTNNYTTWLHLMNASGYASAKGKWIKDISTVIRKFNLSLYDKQ